MLVVLVAIMNQFTNNLSPPIIESSNNLYLKLSNQSINRTVNQSIFDNKAIKSNLNSNRNMMSKKRKVNEVNSNHYCYIKSFDANAINEVRIAIRNGGLLDKPKIMHFRKVI